MARTRSGKSRRRTVIRQRQNRRKKRIKVRLAAAIQSKKSA